MGHAIQQLAHAHNYSVVRELVGHGIGRSLHEAPNVHNYGSPGSGIKLKEGMVLAIEPMINLGGRQVVGARAGQVRTLDGKLSAHFEHTVAVLDNSAEILTTYKYIEKGI